jgi:hypothetical protein
VEITLHGWIGIPLGVALLFRPRWLYCATVLAIPFTATALLNSPNDVPLSPAQYLAALLIMYEAARLAVVENKVSVKKGMGVSAFLLWGFLGVVVLSQMMPLLLVGRGWVDPRTSPLLSIQPVQIDSYSFKAAFPVVLGVLFALVTIRRNRRVEDLMCSLKLYVGAGVFVAVWGLMQFVVSNLLGMEYPHWVFNNARLDSMMGYTQQLETGLGVFFRTSSVMHEPSILAKYLATVLVALLMAVATKAPLLGRRMDGLGIVFVVTAILTSASTTGYFALLVSIAVVAWLLRRARGHRRRAVRLAWGAAVAVGTAFYLVPFLQALSGPVLLTKLVSGSYEERVFTVVQGWRYFLQFPVLGLGWGRITVHDLAVHLLANIGALGFTLFVVMCGSVLLQGPRHRATYSGSAGAAMPSMPEYPIGTALQASMITLLAVSLLSGLEFYLLPFYFLFGMLAASRTLQLRFSERHSRSEPVLIHSSESGAWR